MKIFIEITKSAEEQIKKILNENPKNKILFFIKKNGCYGNSYEFKLIPIKDNSLDIILFIFKDIKLYILKKDIELINNIRLDFIKTNFKEKFVFINKKIKNICGCGKSFYNKL